MRFFSALLLCLLLLPTDGYSELASEFKHLRLTQYGGPEYLTHDELVKLSSNPKPGGALGRKVEKLINTPFVSNEAAFRGASPKRPRDPSLGPFLRIVQWNIEKSMNMKEAIWAFKNEKEFETLIDTTRFPKESDAYQEILQQRRLLESADLVILEEMDVGMKRSDYLDATRVLAEALDMNYVYGAAYLEIDTLNLGTEKFVDEKGVEDKKLQEMFRVEPEKYRGLFGTSVLSRYPILKVRYFQLKYQPYDWYEGEKIPLATLEKAKRGGAKAVFLERLFREMKVGGRAFMQVDLYIPELPEKKLSVINVHLEIKCVPKGREIQMAEMLSEIIDIKNPVILAGDFNSASGDMSPTSVRRELRRTASNPTFWLDQAVRYLHPAGLLITLTRGATNVTKNLQNPTARHIPLIAPNKQKGMFGMIEDFIFYDGHRFDFRGNRKRSSNGKTGLLANSNHRDLVGYKTSFTTDRTVFKVLGKQRLDWVFVKGYLKDPKDNYGPYRFAPHFARTLEEMNDGLRERISDHHPSVVDIPFEEPKI